VRKTSTRDLFEASIRYDPAFAMAHAMLAWTHVLDVMNGWSDDRQASLQQALDLATRALTLDEQLPLAYWVRGLTYRETGDYVKALVEAEQAIEYKPSYANAHVLLASLLYFAGRPEEGLKRILKAIEINPHHPFNYTFPLGQAYFTLHRYRDAIAALRKALESNPGSERIMCGSPPAGTRRRAGRRALGSDAGACAETGVLPAAPAAVAAIQRSGRPAACHRQPAHGGIVVTCRNRRGQAAADA
jgi:tetratricopeptide (TPR) repeat protein